MSLSDTELHALLERARVIAIVGMSPNESKPSHYVPQFMIEHGYTIVPVNPLYPEIAGMTCYPDLKSVPMHIDIVNVFRRTEDTPPIAEEAVAVGAGCLWLQLGIVNQEAARIAEAGGLQVVQDLCIKVEYDRLFEPPHN